MDVRDDVVDILAGFSLFADLSTPELESLVGTFGEETFQDGDRVLRQGLTGSNFYVILEGAAAIRVDGVKRSTLRPGDFFGEISVLLGVPPVADIVAHGGLQLTYSLRRFGIEHAVISSDPQPGGMFRRWPIFQRMLSWTKPYAEHERGTPAYERYDWNSLLADEQTSRAIMPSVMDGTSYFPSRPEMERGLVIFAERSGIEIRFGCRWESTSKDGNDFVLSTSDGEYRAPIAVFAVGVAEPWKPQVLNVEGVEQYGELRRVETYANRRVFIAGKQNSGFEIASGLLPLARQIVLASPSHTKLSVDTRSLVGVRARAGLRGRRCDRRHGIRRTPA